MATYRLKEWFLTITGTANKAGTRFKDGDKPNESTFADWFKSSLFKSEPDDRAKEDVAGTTLADINGHVVAATDAQAKANQAKKEDRTVVAQASQLPTNEVDSNVVMNVTTLNSNYETTVNEFDDQTLDIETAGSTRNIFKHKFSAPFVIWFNLVLTTISDFSFKLKDLNTRVALLSSSIVTPGGDPSLSPIGTMVFSLNPTYITDSNWRYANGQTWAPKYLIPDDSTSGSSVIYSLLSAAFVLEETNDPVGDPNALNFKLPNLSNRVPYGQVENAPNNLGFNGVAAGQWGGTITKANLPKHQHESNVMYGGDLEAVDSAGTKHTHRVPYQDGTGTGDVNATASINGSDAINTIEGDGGHTHIVGGKTGTHDVDWGQNAPFLFTPPTIGGGWLIRVV